MNSEILNTVKTAHGNSLAYREAIRELRRLNSASPQPMFEGLMDQHVSMLRNSRNSEKCRAGCLRELQAITLPESQTTDECMHPPERSCNRCSGSRGVK